jgi:type IV secretory pathway VirB3-like protein
MTQTPINDSLNRTRTKCGLELWALALLVGVCGAVAYFISLIAAIAIAVAVLSLAKYLTAKDPRIFRLWLLACTQHAYYDPGKRQVAK